MAFEATKRELGELYTFFRLLADGKVSLGTPQVRKDEAKCWPIAMVQREEHDGTRRYYIEKEDIHIVATANNATSPARALFDDTLQICWR